MAEVDKTAAQWRDPLEPEQYRRHAPVRDHGFDATYAARAPS